MPGASQTSGSSSSASAATARPSKIDDLTKATKFVRDTMQKVALITNKATYLQFLTHYYVVTAQGQTMDMDLSVHTLVNGVPRFKTTEANKPVSAMWLTILTPLCSDPGNPIASRVEAMLSKGESGAEAMALLHEHYLGESSVETSLDQIEELLFMEFDPATDVSRSLYVTQATDLMDKIELEIPEMEFAPIIRVFLCLRILDKEFVQKVREWLCQAEKSIDSLDVERLHAVIKKLESLQKRERGSSWQKPSSNHSASGSNDDTSANAAGAAKAAIWKDCFKLLTQCPPADKAEHWRKSIQGKAPCVFCLSPSSETNDRKVTHVASACPSLRKLGYTIVGCDEKTGTPTNTLGKKKEIERYKKEIADLKAKLKSASAKSAETEDAGGSAPSGYAAAVEKVAEPKKWSDVASMSAFEELDL